MDLISIGLVADDRREFYRISNEFDEHTASDWVRDHVLTQLEARELGLWSSRRDILADLVAFVGEDTPAFWTWCGLYDWLAVIQLFGGLDRLPAHWPYFANDLMQWCTQLGLTTDDPRLPQQVADEHHALADARHNQAIYAFLSTYQRKWIASLAESAR